MKKMTKDQIKRLEELKTQLENATAAQHEAATVYDAAVSGAHEELAPIETTLREVIEECNAFLEEVCEEIRGAFDEKSEKWQASDAGQQVESWIGALEDAQMEDFEPLAEPDVTPRADDGDWNPPISADDV